MANLSNWRKSNLPRAYRHPLGAIEKSLDKALEDFYKAFELPAYAAEDWEHLSINPSIDIVEDDKNFKLEAEMPGMGPEDLSISVVNGLLTIKGEKNTSSQDKGKNYLMREIGYGAYQRSVALPESVDLDKAQATFKKGMLWITIPKKAEAIKPKIREIKIEAKK